MCGTPGAFLDKEEALEQVCNYMAAELAAVASRVAGHTDGSRCEVLGLPL